MIGIMAAWWPLALSWMMMGLEMPLISAVLARLPNETIQLAAFGGVVFPLALLVEAPVIMMLAASTALCTNDRAYKILKRFMVRLAISMTLLHILFGFTPLFDTVLVPLLDMPEEVIEPSRAGFRLMLPWTWAIADRRFNQGILIRFGKRRAVAAGTAVRLVATLTVLLSGWLLGVEGASLAGSALGISTMAEAIYARWQVAPVISGPLIDDPINDVVVKGIDLWKFYIPLAMTPFITLAMHPIGAAGIDRMPSAVTSLAVWTPIAGLAFFCRSPGIALNEVVIGFSANADSKPALRKFAIVAGLVATIILAILSLPAISSFWFGGIIHLPPALTELGIANIWIAIPIPLMTFLQSYYQGIAVNAHRTRMITESVVVYALVMIVVIVIGIAIQPPHGITVVLIATAIGNLAQTLWLWYRCLSLKLEE